jgi:microcystin-dependent protein
MVATVIGKTSEKIDELLDETVVSGSIDGDGNLIFTTRGGAEQNAGSVVKMIGAPWSPDESYEAGDVVGYAGKLYKALTSSTNKPPATFTTLWKTITGEDSKDWVQADPNFNGNNFSDAWDVSEKSISSSVAYTTTGGEFESGGRGLKITLPGVSDIVTVINKEQNLWNYNEVIAIEVRVRRVSGSALATVKGFGRVNSDSGGLTSGASGAVNTTVSPTSEVLSDTSWHTFTFMSTHLENSKSRGIAGVQILAPAAAVVVIDYIKIFRLPLRVAMVESPALEDSSPRVVSSSWVKELLRGTIHAFAGSTAPEGALMCDGSSYAVADYASLHDIIGYTYGGSGPNFNVPDLRHRFPFGANGDLGSSEGLSVGSRAARLGHAHTHGAGTLATGGPSEVYDNNPTDGAASRAGPNHTHSISGNTASGGPSEHPRLNLNYIIFY